MPPLLLTPAPRPPPLIQAHALKNKDSTRTKKLGRVAESCMRRILLTGGRGRSPPRAHDMSYDSRPLVLMSHA